MLEQRLAATLSAAERWVLSTTGQVGQPWHGKAANEGLPAAAFARLPDSMVEGRKHGVSSTLLLFPAVQPVVATTLEPSRELTLAPRQFR